MPPEFSSLPAVLGTLTRYRHDFGHGAPWGIDAWVATFNPDPKGEWVKFEDVARIVSALQQQKHTLDVMLPPLHTKIASLKAEVSALQHEIAQWKAGR